MKNKYKLSNLLYNNHKCEECGAEVYDIEYAPDADGSMYILECYNCGEFYSYCVREVERIK